MECKTGDRLVDIKIRLGLGTCPVELFDVGRSQEGANASILNLASDNDDCSGTDLRCGNLTWSVSHNSGLLFICYVWVRIWIIANCRNDEHRGLSLPGGNGSRMIVGSSRFCRLYGLAEHHRDG